MAGRTTTAMQPGQILDDSGAESFRGELLSGRTMRCANLWMASAQLYNDGAAEIEIFCSFDPRVDRWDAEIYYYSFERAVQALREYEQTGNMPEGE